jgi:DNA primase
MGNLDFERLIEKVKLKSDIVSVIGRRVKLNNNKALCPFHNEKTPSFSVNIQGQYFFCFGCRRGGDAITFVQLFEGVDFREAIYILAEEANIRY